MTVTGPSGNRAAADVPDRAPDASAGAVVVESMRRRHLRAVLRIEGRTSTTPWSLGLFVAELGRGDERVYLVARQGGRVVGYAGALLVAGEAHVTTIAVDPDHRGRAIATRLLSALVRRCVDLGVGAVTLEVRASNEAALALYRRFGFVPAGVRKGYYSKPVEDALVLWAHDVAEAAYAERLADIDRRLDPAPHDEGAPTTPEGPRP
ncbi:MAG: ribosomal protein S18-alanine N-acetyltransferase [Acidimicrobiales bacterium]|nr:ribosomal protein S18-alanine N-acetyltransferase [Acidimicrobiales bacterium]